MVAADTKKNKNKQWTKNSLDLQALGRLKAIWKKRQMEKARPMLVVDQN